MKTRVALLKEMGRPRPYDATEPLEIIEAELAPPGPSELLVRMTAAGLCHSDLSVINGNRPRETPLALGHEASGVVEEVGPGVTRFAPGDPLVLVFAPTCGRCVPCAEGRPALCEPGFAAAKSGTLITGARRITVAGAGVNHHLGVSAFSDRAIVSEASCVKVSPSIPLEEAALLGCAVVTGVGAVLNTGGLRLGQSCGVFGLGGVGLAALLGARAGGARQIVAVDISTSKLEKALDLGADHAVNAADPDAAEQILDLTHGGLDLAVEIAGVAAALQLAYDTTRRGGVTVTAGLPHPSAELAIPISVFTASEKTVKGSFMGSCVPARDIPRYGEMMVSGRLPIQQLLTHRMPLEDINTGFERLAAGEALRQLVVFDAA